jgi:hypothetical protein
MRDDCQATGRYDEVRNDRSSLQDREQGASPGVAPPCCVNERRQRNGGNMNKRMRRRLVKQLYNARVGIYRDAVPLIDTNSTYGGSDSSQVAAHVVLPCESRVSRRLSLKNEWKKHMGMHDAVHVPAF